MKELICMRKILNILNLGAISYLHSHIQLFTFSLRGEGRSIKIRTYVNRRRGDVTSVQVRDVRLGSEYTSVKLSSSVSLQFSLKHFR